LREQVARLRGRTVRLWNRRPVGISVGEKGRCPGEGKFARRSAQRGVWPNDLIEEIGILLGCPACHTPELARLGCTLGIEILRVPLVRALWIAGRCFELLCQLSAIGFWKLPKHLLMHGVHLLVAELTDQFPIASCRLLIRDGQWVLLNTLRKVSILVLPIGV